jgi:hypothetical protein
MRPRPVLALVLALAATAGCGIGPGEDRDGGADLRVTRDFGQRSLGGAREDTIREDDTVLRVLRSQRRVETSFGGRFVQSIDGIEGRGVAGTRDWFFFVNGVEASEGAAEYELSPGDVVQWDYRDWRATMTVPAIVGAFPEPFRNGLEGKRFPVRIECADDGSDGCREAKRRLREQDIPVNSASLGAEGTENVIRLVVGRWGDVRRVAIPARLAGGPDRTGVFARFGGGGLELLAANGRVRRRAGAGTGLLAALAPSRDRIVWVVTALDEAGVVAAARALEPRTLRDAFAVAAGPAGVERLPLGAGG